MEYSATHPPSLLAVSAAEESAQILRATLWLLRCLFVVDIVYLVGGISIIVLAHSHHLGDRDLVFCGVLLGLFAAMSAMCNR